MTFADMNTRLGNAGDYQAVVPMMRQFRLRHQRLDPGLYELRPDAEERFRRWVGETAEALRSMLVVAEEQGRVAGFLTTTVERDLPIYVHDEFAMVREWWVEPQFDRQAVGKALIDFAAAELAEMGVRQIRVRTAVGDDEARSLLQHGGFRSGWCEMVRELRPA